MLLMPIKKCVNLRKCLFRRVSPRWCTEYISWLWIFSLFSHKLVINDSLYPCGHLIFRKRSGDNIQSAGNSTLRLRIHTDETMRVNWFSYRETCKLYLFKLALVQPCAILLCPANIQAGIQSSHMQCNVKFFGVFWQKPSSLALVVGCCRDRSTRETSPIQINHLSRPVAFHLVTS